jgi:hypothetical protein
VARSVSQRPHPTKKGSGFV